MMFGACCLVLIVVVFCALCDVCCLVFVVSCVDCCLRFVACSVLIVV